ncbi:hypothetical protein B0H14DRAFT_1450931 [Mycena olivaceomarginata]|nr:hypothetical protein B0H14DRAFT_1450931 [Mycena olivaceomarginata]
MLIRDQGVPPHLGAIGVLTKGRSPNTHLNLRARRTKRTSLDHMIVADIVYVDMSRNIADAPLSRRIALPPIRPTHPRFRPPVRARGFIRPRPFSPCPYSSHKPCAPFPIRPTVCFTRQLNLPLMSSTPPSPIHSHALRPVSLSAHRSLRAHYRSRPRYRILPRSRLASLPISWRVCAPNLVRPRRSWVLPPAHHVHHHAHSFLRPHTTGA